MANSVDISVVIPLYNEEESLPELYAWIVKVMTENNFSFEVFFMNDGSTDSSWEVIQKLHNEDPEHVRAIRFRKNQGKSAALNVGFKKTKGDVVITMDADLQDSPDEIPDLYKMIMEDGWDLVSGWKKKRHDPLSKTIPTKLFNWATRKMSGIYLHDFNCGLKAYKGEVVQNVDVTGEMHRYIPILAKNAGFPKITEKVVVHQARKYGTTKFGLDRFINGFLDLLTLYVVTRFSKRPMHFFGLIGTLMFFIGFVAMVGLIAWKFWKLSAGGDPGLIADNPLFYMFLTSMLLGTQLFTTGFLAELMSRNSAKTVDYTIDETLGE
ncbi:glycosyltransferase family 2 protein [Phaeocystidibacter marisrubri]|uniref:Glycosyltransferase family 2 protein n=1 Tax=Phaeocystidibacter marisrubri TaxID=1577780 RepID=A0A6L3ZHF6_9FLAO|nr:glycosyltransferase family 2 protein [Phaeocystidibacter marisrubri]KAB2817432.1 glycosyltransferase family 2 protein [Phaeocystidibacter marisrubri]GGH75385.1 glycosyl transferase [Phaeocystidibacter marisrubri]